MSNVKICHFADIQINIDSRNADRTTEYRSVLHSAADKVAKLQPQFIVIAGDVFERYATTDNERELYVQWIHKMLSTTDASILVIDGNHDVRKRNLTYYDGNDTAMQTNVLAEIAAAINSPRYLYSRDAKLYQFDNLVFACWSELAKYDASLCRSPYDKLQAETLVEQGNFLIDVYHGTLKGAKDFGNDMQLEPDADILFGHIAMLGHIHKPQELHNSQDVYCSSLVQRSFNEGLRLDANGVAYDYRDMHGFVVWNINTETKHFSHEFVPIFQPKLMTTFVLTADVTVDMLLSYLRMLADRTLSIKLILDRPNPEALAFMYNYCNMNQRCNIKKVETVVHQTELSSNIAAERIDLSPEAFKQIASSLLHDKMQIADDKFNAAVFDKTMQLFEQECVYHLHPEQRNHIIFKSVVIDNFKTIGHAELALNATGLTALRGQNGEGKTTCFEAIAFALTGQHNRTFKRNAKNKQFIRLFNDKQPEVDTVSIVVELCIDGKDIEVRTCLQKTMTDGWSLANWKSYVSKVIKTVQIAIDNQVIAEGDAADDWLMQYFGTYDDFAILHMIDQSTLDAIKYMAPDDFANFILQRLGYSVFSKLQYYYAGCKNNALQDTPKPTAKSYVELQQELDNLAINANNATTESKQIDTDIDNLQTQYDALQSEMTKLQNAKQSVPQALIDQCNAAITAAGDNIETKLVQVRQSIAEANAVAAKLTEEKDKQAKLQAEAQKYIDDLVQIEIAVNDRLAKNNEQLHAYEYELASIEAANEALEQTKQSLTDNIAKYTSTKTLQTTLLAQLEQTIINEQSKCDALSQQIDTLQPNVCPTCGNDIDLDKFNAYKTELEQRLVSMQADIDLLQANRQNHIDNIAYCNAQIEKLNEQLQALHLQDTTELEAKTTALRASVQSDNTLQINLHRTDYQQKLLKANSPMLAASLYASNAALQQLQVKYDSIDYMQLLNVQQVCEQAIAAKQTLQVYDNILAANAIIDEQIVAKQMELRGILTKSAELQSAKNKLASDLAVIKQSIDNTKQLQQQVVAYDICIAALQQYKWLVFEAMPKYMYSNACKIVNAYIDKQNLPASIRPWLSETEYGQLMLRDRSEIGKDILRPILEASGMEITITGLVICLAMHDARLSVDFPLVLLDELSGKLNTGTITDTTDYLATLLHVLQSASKTCQLVIIDHRLNEDAFDSIININKNKTTNIAYTE